MAQEAKMVTRQREATRKDGKSKQGEGGQAEQTADATEEKAV